jgi:hypothetical protein
MGRCRMKTIDVKRAITLFFFMPVVRDKEKKANDTRVSMRFLPFEASVKLKLENLMFWKERW